MASTYDQWKTESGYAEKTPEQENEGRDCPVCGGDCAGANPPVYHCPMKEPPLMSSTEKTHTPDANGWMPIETAPRDSEIMLAWRAISDSSGEPVWCQTIGEWEEQFEYAWDDDKGGSEYRGAWTDYTVASWPYEEYVELHPTHWQPLLAPPVQP